MTGEEAIRELKIQFVGEYDRQRKAKDRAIKALEQEAVLDKIRERIELEKLGYPPSAGYYRAIMKVLRIIDKYKAESEEQECQEWKKMKRLLKKCIKTR